MGANIYCSTAFALGVCLADRAIFKTVMLLRCWRKQRRGYDSAYVVCAVLRGVLRVRDKLDEEFALAIHLIPTSIISIVKRPRSTTFLKAS